MFLANKRTGARIMLAKYYPSTGWYTSDKGLLKRLDEAFDAADFGHLTQDQRTENSEHVGLGAPHISYGQTYGEEWVLEYETEPSVRTPVSPSGGEK
jgi:hypothetical protein